MATVTNSELIEIAQTVINTNGKMADNLKAFTVAFDGTVLPGDSVLVPVIKYGATVKNGSDFSSDGSNSVEMKKVSLVSAAYHPTPFTDIEWRKVNAMAPKIIKGSMDIIGNDVTDTLYGQLTSANFSGVVSANWTEATASLEKLRVLVEKAKGTGKLDRNNIKVLMPSDTYGIIADAYDARYRDINPGFEIIPVRSESFTKTWVTDGSAIAVGFGADVGNDAEDFEYIESSDSTIGYGLHIYSDAEKRKKKIVLNTSWGWVVANANGALRAV